MALNQQLLQRLAAAKKKQQTATGTYQQPQQGTWQATATGHQYVAPGQQATPTTNTSGGNFTPPAGATSTVTGFEDGVKIGPRGSVQRIGGQTTTTYNSMGQQTGTAQKTFNPTTYQSTQPKYTEL